MDLNTEAQDRYWAQVEQKTAFVLSQDLSHGPNCGTLLEIVAFRVLGHSLPYSKS